MFPIIEKRLKETLLEDIGNCVSMRGISLLEKGLKEIQSEGALNSEDVDLLFRKCEKRTEFIKVKLFSEIKSAISKAKNLEELEILSSKLYKIDGLDESKINGLMSYLNSRLSQIESQ
jgi:hypothetical protein